MTVRYVTASILCAAAAVFIVPNAEASPSKRPAPDSQVASCNQQDIVTRLLDQVRHATTLKERQLIHHELVEVIHSGEC
jgi:hypothetical protein